jgi:integrase
MKARYRMFVRGAVFYAEDSETRKQESLRTKDPAEAQRLLAAKNETHNQPRLNLQLARTYLLGADPRMNERTWADVMNEAGGLKKGPSKIRWVNAMKQDAFDSIRNVVVVNTRAEQFIHVLTCGTVSTNVFLRRLHNFALDMNWLPVPVISRKQWPPVRFEQKRAITRAEHENIIQNERNAEWHAFYELCWHIGAAQSDVGTLRAENIDWEMRVISFERMKTKSLVQLHFGDELAALLRTLPSAGPLLPRIAVMKESDRAKAFIRRCKLAKVPNDVSLHCYRYAWAERAKVCGYPERFAQQALGHNSTAVHRAYARKAQVALPSLEKFEREYAEKVVKLEQKAA